MKIKARGTENGSAADDESYSYDDNYSYSYTNAGNGSSYTYGTNASYTTGYSESIFVGDSPLRKKLPHDASTSRRRTVVHPSVGVSSFTSPQKSRFNLPPEPARASEQEADFLANVTPYINDDNDVEIAFAAYEKPANPRGQATNDYFGLNPAPKDDSQKTPKASVPTNSAKGSSAKKSEKASVPTNSAKGSAANKSDKGSAASKSNKGSAASKSEKGSTANKSEKGSTANKLLAK